MTKQGKKYIKASGSYNRDLTMSPQEGFAKVKELAFASFDESVDVNVNLGIDPSQGEQVVRGAVVLPHGRGKTIRVIVFAKGDYVEEAKEAGADYVGAEDLVEKIAGGWMDFDFAIATPDLMGMVGQLAKQLGPRGLLPNKKVGTVTFKVGDVVKELKQGKLFFKNDKSGIIHFPLGKISFETQQLVDNFNAFMKALIAAKPAASKGKFIKSITVSSTMGVGVRLNPDEAARL